MVRHPWKLRGGVAARLSLVLRSVVSPGASPIAPVCPLGRPITLLMTLMLTLVACASEDQPVADRAMRDYNNFRNGVYPILLRDCGFPACHGDHRRFFRVFGPGRTRLPNSSGEFPEAFAIPGSREISLSYTLALDMIDTAEPGRSPLLLKPLSVGAGGAGHKGVDAFGRDVYRTTRDDGYETLSKWVLTVPEPAMPAAPTPAPGPAAPAPATPAPATQMPIAGGAP